MDTRRERIDIERSERSIRLLAANRIDNYGKDRVDDVLRNNATPPTSIGYGAATTRSKTSHSMRTSPRKRYSFAPQRPQSPRENIHDRSKQQKFLNTQTSSPKRVRGYMVHQYPKHMKHGCTISLGRRPAEAQMDSSSRRGPLSADVAVACSLFAV